MFLKTGLFQCACVVNVLQVNSKTVSKGPLYFRRIFVYENLWLLYVYVLYDTMTVLNVYIAQLCTNLTTRFHCTKLFCIYILKFAQTFSQCNFFLETLLTYRLNCMYGGWYSKS